MSVLTLLVPLQSDRTGLIPGAVLNLNSSHRGVVCFQTASYLAAEVDRRCVIVVVVVVFINFCLY